MRTVVLFHANCPDGFTAAWAAWRKFGDTAEYIPARFDEKERPDLTGADVYIVDFSYPRDVTLAINAEVNSLVVLDHHKSARKNLEGIEGCFFDMDRSGAGMSWDYFHPDVPRPSLISYVEDRDLWRFALPHSKEVNSVVTSYEFTFDNWNAMHLQLETDFEQVRREGVAILRSKLQYVSVMVARNSHRERFLGYDDIPIVNAPHISISELVGRLAEDAPFAAGWSQSADGMFLYSLRSRGDGLDVSEVASVMGGGGHRGSAGFHSEKPPWELDKDVKTFLAVASVLAEQPKPDMGDLIAQAVTQAKMTTT